MNVHGSYSNYKAGGSLSSNYATRPHCFRTVDGQGREEKSVIPAVGWVLHPEALLQRVENQLNVVATGSGVHDTKAQYRLPLVLGRRYQTFSLFQKLITPCFVLVG